LAEKTALNDSAITIGTFRSILQIPSF
jgi:hypothetical protein